NAAPASPPRFIEPTTTLPSKAPRSSKSSRMSAVASTPLTPGRSRATSRRSSSSPRSAIAIGSRPAPSAPRAGWSAAITSNLPEGPTKLSGRTRRAAASAIASGRLTRCSTIERTRSADTGALLQERGHLGGGRHGIGAGEPGRDDGSGSVGEAHTGLQRRAGQQHVAQRSAEGIAGAEPVEDLDGDGRDVVAAGVVHGQDPVWTALHDGGGDAELAQCRSGLFRVAGADGGLAFVEVAHGDRGVAQRGSVVDSSGLARLPEHRAVVQVEHRVTTAPARF